MSIKYNNLENNVGQYLSDNSPVCLYIHIPFCQKKCYYCDFYSIPVDSSREKSLMDSYIDALIREMDIWNVLGLRKLKTIYVGGGTPSILSPQQCKRLIEGIRTRFLFDDRIEFTVEVNPESVSKEKLMILKVSGVNRLSVGIQSFDDGALTGVGRITRYKNIVHAIDVIREVGFDNVNFDLILGIQNDETFKRDLERAVSFSPTHISVYMLHLSEDTLLSRMVKTGEFRFPDEQYFKELYFFTVDFLEDKGYEQYEISNFSIPGHKSQHNLNYWKGGNYIGMGAGGVSTLGKYRIGNPKDVGLYIENLMMGNKHFYLEEFLNEKTKLKEMIMLSLRTEDGLELEIMRDFLNESVFSNIMNYLSRIEELGMARIEGNRFVLTPEGFLRFNTLVSEIFGLIESY